MRQRSFEMPKDLSSWSARFLMRSATAQWKILHERLATVVRLQLKSRSGCDKIEQGPNASMTSDRFRRYVPLPVDRESLITDLAEAVADEFCPSGHVEPPLIIKGNEITAVFNDYGDSFDGMLEHLNGRFCIYCNLGRVEQAESPRARFTLAHELGHFYIDDHRNALASGRAPKHGSRCEYESDELVEKEADLFASHLLLPTKRFRKKASEGRVGLSAILQIADHFKTSVTSTAIRYVKADFVPCALVKW